ncbi:MAG: NADH-quinone oxidoreductase subunit J [Promethearchaeota archaeon]
MSLSRTVVVGLLGLILLSVIMLLLFALDFFIAGLHLSMYAVYILIIMTAIFAILAIEDKDLLHAALYLAGSAVTLALLYLVLFAIWVAFFQLAVYAGAVSVLIISGISLTTRRGTGEVTEEDV